MCLFRYGSPQQWGRFAAPGGREVSQGPGPTELPVLEPHDDFADLEAALHGKARDEASQEVIGRTDSAWLQDANKLTFADLLDLKIE